MSDANTINIGLIDSTVWAVSVSVKTIVSKDSVSDGSTSNFPVLDIICFEYFGITTMSISFPSTQSPGTGDEFELTGTQLAVICHIEVCHSHPPLGALKSEVKVAKCLKWFTSLTSLQPVVARWSVGFLLKNVCTGISSTHPNFTSVI